MFPAHSSGIESPFVFFFNPLCREFIEASDRKSGTFFKESYAMQAGFAVRVFFFRFIIL